MDYCNPQNQIKTYAPTATGATTTLFAKNIDCVNLDADLVACDELTIKGVPLTNIDSVTRRTQNILDTTDANQTLMIGILEAPDIETSSISAIDPATGVSITSAVNASNNITMSGTSAALVQSGASATASLKATTVTSLTATGNANVAGTLNVAGNTTLKYVEADNVGAINNVYCDGLEASSYVSSLGVYCDTLYGPNDTDAVTIPKGFYGAITQSSGTASLKTVTATSVSNSGTLTQTGAATFATNITQSAGTSSLKAVTATTLATTGNATVGGALSVTGVISGTFSNTVLGTSTSTGDANSTTRTWSVGNLLPYEMWFSWRNLKASGWIADKKFQLKVVTSTDTPTFDDGSHTTGTNGSGSINWSSNIIYLWNSTLTAPNDGTNVNLCGHLRFSRVPAPSGVTDILYTVFGVANRRDLNGYVCNLMGVLRLTSGQTISSLQISCDSVTGVSCTGYLGYNR